MITRRRVLLAVLALFLVGVGTVAWTLAGQPPVKYYLRYGLDPFCEPTGAKETHEGVEFVEIGPGIFRMGSTFRAEGGDWLGKICKPFGLPWGKQPSPSDEIPVHWVEFRHGFWIARTEVTNAQYERYRPEHPRKDTSAGDDEPVVVESWEEAKDYCAWLATKSDRPIRLPSEAEWECACRAGSDADFTFGDEKERLSEYAWFDENSERRAHQVATKLPNRWGLFDLHGNVWEWCIDTWHVGYDGAPSDGSAWTAGGWESSWEPGSMWRVHRGGSVAGFGDECRSAHRFLVHPEDSAGLLGFRPAMSCSDD